MQSIHYFSKIVSLSLIAHFQYFKNGWLFDCVSMHRIVSSANPLITFSPFLSLKLLIFLDFCRFCCPYCCCRKQGGTVIPAFNLNDWFYWRGTLVWCNPIFCCPLWKNALFVVLRWEIAFLRVKCEISFCFGHLGYGT